LVLDAHSFPSSPLPYEMDQQSDRPEICVGTDEFHTPKALELSLVNAFRDGGFTVKLNSPFLGALVPQVYFKKDRRVSAAMVEVRRDLYADESTGERARTFTQVAEKIRNCLAIACTSYHQTD
jgi:N-formylglutamate amidohydrolase